MKNKILVGTIFSDVKDYAIRDWFNNVAKFTHPGFDFCAIDNSSDKKYHKKMLQYFKDNSSGSQIGKISVLHTSLKHKRSKVFMSFSSNDLRNYFLSYKYDWLLYLECDVVPPVDILERLLSYKKQIISATYFVSDKTNSYPMMGDVHFFSSQAPHMYIKGALEGFYSLGEAVIPNETVNGGLGCTLLYKDVIEQIPFRYDPKFIVHNDTMFAKDIWERDLQALQVPIMCDHDNRTWDIQEKIIARK